MSTTKDKDKQELARFRETREIPQGGIGGPGMPKVFESRVSEMPVGSERNNPSIVKVADDEPLTDWSPVEKN